MGISINLLRVRLPASGGAGAPAGSNPHVLKYALVAALRRPLPATRSLQFLETPK